MCCCICWYVHVCVCVCVCQREREREIHFFPCENRKHITSPHEIGNREKNKAREREREKYEKYILFFSLSTSHPTNPQKDRNLTRFSLFSSQGRLMDRVSSSLLQKLLLQGKTAIVTGAARVRMNINRMDVHDYLVQGYWKKLCENFGASGSCQCRYLRRGCHRCQRHLSPVATRISKYAVYSLCSGIYCITTHVSMPMYARDDCLGRCSKRVDSPGDR